ncbi:hypothetical protein [Nocardioides sp.]|uniref:hypothetical protein n=1 Tax=Nocardioides sp. TaxID=35761 RepID=UPI002ED654A1
MKRPLVIPALLAVALALVVAGAAPASAKGATSVTVTGPGISELEVDHWTRPTDDVDLGTLSEVSGIYGIFGDGQLTAGPDVTEGELGPRYVLTWYQASRVMAVSHIYPFAEGGAWAHVPRHQRLWGEALNSGWWHGGAALEAAMVTLGATVPVTADPTDSSGEDDAAAPAAAAALPPDDSTPGSSPVTAGGLALGVGLLLAAGFWLVRRRRTTQPGLTLSRPA